MPTPRSHPNYNVHFSNAKIKAIVSKSLDDVDDDEISIEPLPSGRSFNNRIYYININTRLRVGEESVTSDTETETEEELEKITSRRTPATTSFALKIIGRGFDERKIQNEISCLLLLEKYCPSLSIPRVLSWSEDGEKVQTRSNPQGHTSLHEAFLAGLDGEEDASKESVGQGWMLLSRVPGHAITLKDLKSPYGSSIMRQIAAYVANWRTNMPPGNAIGNLILLAQGEAPPPAATLYVRSILPGMDVYIQGRLTGHVQPTKPLVNHLVYVTHRLNSALRKLEEVEIYAHIQKPMTAMVRRFLQNTLPYLRLFANSRVPQDPLLQSDGLGQAFVPQKSVFTHYDLSPRNVLVTESADGVIEVSAILDVEFSGLYPEPEEFANTLVNDAYDWENESYAVFLEQLRELNAVPASLAQPNYTSYFEAKKFDDDTKQEKEIQDEIIPFGDVLFHQACLVMRIIENVAPWWVKELSGLSDDELKEELFGALRRVKRSIISLEEMDQVILCSTADILPGPKIGVSQDKAD
ncbi:hypothetical protein PV10_06032 [Exophiala mesophila]|uniref:Aminoglycoside phosphotransferase domain-containing protein n=1 Tax=Exophiala mesophila TaxID=212818 RepID=A0A0D1WQZ6_EXOME|nr:uncharacterized protein PV10_06032 [Exophiala mesophila]KIV91500.1 hypothetical protein PV10_06032 [Exophiala mesophila]